ncbi:MAG: hypothetical protein ABW220_07995 [Burkholderiaceae bacterium]
MGPQVFIRFITRLLQHARRRMARPVGQRRRSTRMLGDAPVRAVPLQVQALSVMLNTEEGARHRLRHLALLESACLTHQEDPFSRLPVRTLDVASRQLALAADHSPSLDVLRVQLERYRQEQRSRVEAALSAGDQAASLAVARLSFSVNAAWADTEFLETQPLEWAEPKAA